ncbi:conserved unknown protein [Ectocarpus siliculosus]|uniref:K Homology domain-containing protein n=1 Tax=Ectocarpus siliculosus TaxID=2880 RepID=D7FM83_ECTSI|nr:conserved unknown protein [Ectocarpus siliculosus]|eukprot:CBJ29906.1 conserved unknown protein [Ectocarpus siliculosus]
MPPQLEGGGRGFANKEGVGVQDGDTVWVKRSVEVGGVGSPVDGAVTTVEGMQQGGGSAGGGDVCGSLAEATARMHLADPHEGGDEEEGHDHLLSGGDGEEKQDWSQGDEDREEREREPQPKFALKVLVPGITAGCLIGKGGKIINQIQTNTNTRVKLSQKNEFFPGTHDRVALVQGEQPTLVAEAVAEMLRRLREAARPTPQAPFMGGGVPYSTVHEGYGSGGLDGPHGRDAQVTIRLLVPLAAGGLIIGRGGETIKAIGARTGARVILAGKDADVAGVPSERLCSIQPSMMEMDARKTAGTAASPAT